MSFIVKAQVNLLSKNFSLLFISKHASFERLQDFLKYKFFDNLQRPTLLKQVSPKKNTVTKKDLDIKFDHRKKNQAVKCDHQKDQ